MTFTSIRKKRTSHRRPLLGAALLLVASFTGSTLAQPALTPVEALTGDDSDGTANVFGDAYAAATATWDDWLFAGAPRETAQRDGADFLDGALYAYRRVDGAWVLQQKLTSEEIANPANPFGVRFGAGVAAAGGWLMVAAANDDDFPGLTDPGQQPGDSAFFFAGQVYVYRYNGSTWDFVQRLTAPEPRSSGAFGARTQASHIAINSKGEVAVIGEYNNFADSVGELHTYRLEEGLWRYVQTLEAPEGVNRFGDGLVFANDKYLVAGGAAVIPDDDTIQGKVVVYQAKGNSGKFFAQPAQTIGGRVESLSSFTCPSNNTFGEAGLAAGGDTVAVADPCATAAAGTNAGLIEVYRLGRGKTPLVHQATIEGDAPSLFLGGNTFSAVSPLAVSPSGERIMAGTPLASSGDLDDGGQVRVYRLDGDSWSIETRLDTLTPATSDFRAFGDTVLFTDEETTLVRENNFLFPVVTGLKGQGLVYDLD